MRNLFDSLPEAVLLDLLSFLPRADLRTCAAVDSVFHKFARAAVAWQPTWSVRAGHCEWNSPSSFRIVEDTLLAGGVPLWQLAVLQPPQWPSSLRRSVMRALGLVSPRIDEPADWAAGGRGRTRATRVVRLVGKRPGNDRTAIADAPFPRVSWWSFASPMSIARAMDDTIFPFAWAPPAHGLKSGASNSPYTKANLKSPAPSFQAGAYIVAYYEITILLEPPSGEVPQPQRLPTGNAAPQDDAMRPPTVCVGLASAGFTVDGKMPGWDAQSYGWHGDDGRLYHDSPLGGALVGGFGPGDVIGCGIVYGSSLIGERGTSDVPTSVTRWAALTAEEAGTAWPAAAPLEGRPPGTIFFTRNGRVQGPAFADVDTECGWHPAVGIDAPWPVRFNFGAVAAEPFAFDVRSFNAALLARLSLPPLSQLPVMATRDFLQEALSQVLPLSHTMLAPPPPLPPMHHASGRRSSPSALRSSPQGTPPESPLTAIHSIQSNGIFSRVSQPIVYSGIFLPWSRQSNSSLCESLDTPALCAMRFSFRRRQFSFVLRHMFAMIVLESRKQKEFYGAGREFAATVDDLDMDETPRNSLLSTALAQQKVNLRRNICSAMLSEYGVYIFKAPRRVSLLRAADGDDEIVDRAPDIDHDDGSVSGESFDSVTIKDDSSDAARAALAAESADYLLRVAEAVEQEADEDASIDPLSRVFGNVDSRFSDESPRF